MLQKFDPRNDNIQVNIDGQLYHRDEAKVSVFDSVVQGGDAVWEGLRVYDRRIFCLTEHLDRLRESAQAMAFTQIPSHEEITAEISKTLAANEMYDEAHIRLTLSRGRKITSGMDPRLNQFGPTLIILAEFKKPVYDKSGLKLMTSSIRRPDPDVVDQKIHNNNLINSILAKIQATACGADDAIMLDSRGFIAETNATHLFIVEKAKLSTPQVYACPAGITRMNVLRLCGENDVPCRERNITITEMYAADEVFCTGTMGELAPVTEVDGRTIGSGAAGPLCLKLSELYRKLTETEGTIVV